MFFMALPRNPETDALTGYWKATGHFFRKLIWKILYKNLDLKGGVQGPGRGGLPLYPFLRSEILCWIFLVNSPKQCPVAFQLPALTTVAWLWQATRQGFVACLQGCFRNPPKPEQSMRPIEVNKTNLYVKHDLKHTNIFISLLQHI